MTVEPKLALRSLSALALVFATGSPALAAESRLYVALDYRADETLVGCPGDATFRAMIAGQLGYEPFREGSELTVVARAESAGEGIRGYVTWQDASGAPRGERELASSETDCAAVARAMSFAIAVQIQLFGEEAKPSEERSDEPPSVARPSAKHDAPPSPGDPTHDAERLDAEPSNGSERRWQFVLGAGPGLAFGVAPKTTVAGRVFAAAQRAGFSVELGAEASVPSRHATADGEGFEQQTILGAAAGCALFGALSGCALGKVGTLDVRGFGVDVPRSASGVIAQVGPRIALTQPLFGRWLGRLHVEAFATLVSWKVTLNRHEVWETPPASFALGSELAARFQ